MLTPGFTCKANFCERIVMSVLASVAGRRFYPRADEETFIGSGGRARRMDRNKRGAAPPGAKANGPDGPARRLRGH